MIKREQIEKGVEVLSKKNLAEIEGELDDLTREELKDKFMDAVDEALAKVGKSKIPKDVIDVYNELVDEDSASEGGEEEKTPELEPEPEPEPKPATGKKKNGKKEESPKEEPASGKKKNGKKEVVDAEVVPKGMEITIKGDSSTVADMTTENCPASYEELKAQVKTLALTSANSFLLLGQRLTAIRDQELYKEDGYKNFKQFIDGELNIGKSQVYNAIDLVTYFGVQAIKSNPVSPSLLIPALPLLKADEEKLTKDDKKEVRTTVLKEAKTKSEREMKEVIHGLKEKFGLIEEKIEKNKMDAAFDKLWVAIPDELSAADVKRVQKYIKKLQDILSE